MIDEKYLPYLIEMRGVTTDANGEQVLVGLNAAETAEYFRLNELRGAKEDAEHDRYEELHERHEAARRQVLIAENQLRVDKPTRN